MKVDGGDAGQMENVSLNVDEQDIDNVFKLLSVGDFLCCKQRLQSGQYDHPFFSWDSTQYVCVWVVVVVGGGEEIASDYSIQV